MTNQPHPVYIGKGWNSILSGVFARYFPLPVFYLSLSHPLSLPFLVLNFLFIYTRLEYRHEKIDKTTNNSHISCDFLCGFFFLSQEVEKQGLETRVIEK